MYQNIPSNYHVPSNFHRPDIIDKPLYVITALFNPERYSKRWELYEKFKKATLDAGCWLYTVEATLGERQPICTEDHPRHKVVHLQTDTVMWHKERMLNIGVSRLPQEADYIAFIDADIFFMRPDWVGETIHKLQHHPVIQMFSLAVDVDNEWEPFAMSSGFVHDWLMGKKRHDNYTGPFRKINPFHTGYAWAFRKEVLKKLGGLIDWGILGSSDNHMARCLIGEWQDSVNGGVQQEYKDMLKAWQERAEKYVMRNIGFIKGGIIHGFHGPKQNRQYKNRWQILVDNKFTPSLDLKQNWDGMYQLTDRNWKLRADIQKYFSARSEDDTHMAGQKPFSQYP